MVQSKATLKHRLAVTFRRDEGKRTKISKSGNRICASDGGRDEV
jgi:hypothetical protein